MFLKILLDAGTGPPCEDFKIYEGQNAYGADEDRGANDVEECKDVCRQVGNYVFIGR